MQLIGGHWPDEWEPRGFSTFDVEPFAEWWARHSRDFDDVDSRLVEQWVHRHWSLSPYCGFPIHDFQCRLERLSTETIAVGTGSVDYRRQGDIAPPGDLYNYLNKPLTRDVEPMKTMNLTGTWNLPIALVHDVCGFGYRDERYPDFHYWLLEGHQRQRYLRALDHMGNSAPTHEAFVLVAR